MQCQDLLTQAANLSLGRLWIAMGNSLEAFGRRFVLEDLPVKSAPEEDILTVWGLLYVTAALAGA
eukprot:821712-Lingulodinium_polyedra.AAC.1